MNDATAPSHVALAALAAPRPARDGRGCIVIALGIFMMLQPFALMLYTWSFVDHAGRRRDVHDRLASFPE